jgi:hypothetical protein
MFLVCIAISNSSSLYIYYIVNVLIIFFRYKMKLFIANPKYFPILTLKITPHTGMFNDEDFHSVEILETVVKQSGVLAHRKKYLLCKVTPVFIHHLLLTISLNILKCVTLYQVTIIPSCLYSQMRELRIFKDFYYGNLPTRKLNE